MLLILIVVGLLIIGFFGVTVIFGAPFVPTHKKFMNDVFDLAKLNPGDLILELGSGDGRLLIEAGRRNLRAIGFEINPILFFISWFRIRLLRLDVTVKFGDYRRHIWPAETKAVYIFGTSRDLKYLSKKLSQFPRNVKVISYAYKLSGFKEKFSKNGMILYEINPKSIA